MWPRHVMEAASSLMTIAGVALLLIAKVFS